MVQDQPVGMLGEDGPTITKPFREPRNIVREKSAANSDLRLVPTTGADSRAIRPSKDNARKSSHRNHGAATPNERRLALLLQPDSVDPELKAMSETSSAVGTALKSRDGDVASVRPVNGSRKQSFLHTTAFEHELDPVATGSSSGRGARRLKQSLVDVTAPEDLHKASVTEDGQSRTRTQSSVTPTPQCQSLSGLEDKERSITASTEYDYATAVQDTLSVIREHRRYLDKSCAAAKRSEDVLTRLASTPTESWRAKQKPNVGPVHATANVSGTPLPRSLASPAPSMSRGRPGTAFADRVVTKGTTARGFLVRSRSGARRRRRSASIGSAARSRSSGMSRTKCSAAKEAFSRAHVDVSMHRLNSGEARPPSNIKPDVPDILPWVEGQSFAASTSEADRYRDILLDASMPASPTPISSQTTQSVSRVARTAARQPLPVPQTSPALARLKQSTLPRTIRPDPFALKPEINTRISDYSSIGIRRSRQSRDVSPAPRPAALESSASRPGSLVEAQSSPGRGTSRQPEPGAPAGRRLSQQSTASWSAKVKAPTPVRDEDHLRSLQAMIDDRPSATHSSLQAPNSARISRVGEDFDTCMEGTIRDRSSTAQRYVIGDKKSWARFRQDSGASTNDRVDPPATTQHAQSTLISSLDLSAPVVYDQVVTAWHDDVGWLFSTADQRRSSEHMSSTCPLKTIRARRSSSKLAAEFPSARLFPARIDGAHEDLENQKSSTISEFQVPVMPSTDHLGRAQRESTSFMTKTKNFLLAPFKLGNRSKGGKSSGRPRRGSTGSLMERPTIIPNMANGTQVTLSHANSLRPEHNPALRRSSVPSGHPQTARLPQRRTAQARVRSFLATHHEEAEDALPLSNNEIFELPADEVKLPAE